MRYCKKNPIATDYYKNEEERELFGQYNLTVTRTSTRRTDSGDKAVSGVEYIARACPSTNKQIFDHWETEGIDAPSEQGNPLFVFEMPENDVKITAVFRSEVAIEENKIVYPKDSAEEYGPSEGYGAIGNVTVEAVNASNLNVSENGEYSPGENKFYKIVTVSVPDPVLVEKEITTNGVVTPPGGVDGFNKVVVSVPGPVLEQKTITANGTYTPGSGVDGFSRVDVSVPAPAVDSINAEFTANGTYDRGDGKYYKTVSVDVGGAPVLEEITVKSTGTEQTKIPPSGAAGYSKVTVSPLVRSQLTVTAKETSQTFTPTNDGYNRVYVNSATLQNVSVKSSNTSQTVTPGTGYYGIKKVTVNPVSLPAKTITANGTYTPSGTEDGFGSVTVAVPGPVLEPKTITANGIYTPDAGVAGFDSVLVNVPGGGAITGEITISNAASQTIATFPAAVGAELSSISCVIMLSDSISDTSINIGTITYYATGAGATTGGYAEVDTSEIFKGNSRRINSSGAALNVNTETGSVTLYRSAETSFIMGKKYRYVIWTV